MPATPYTRATLRSAILQEVQDASAVYFNTALVNGLIDDAMADWCEVSRTRIVNWQMDIVASQSIYDLTSLTPRCYEIIRASCPSGSTATDDQELQLLTSRELDDLYPSWRSQTASWPFAVVRDIQGPQSLRLYPTPASSQTATILAGTWVTNANTGMLVSIEGLTAADATTAYGQTVSVELLVGSLQLYGIAGSTDFSSDATTVEAACGISPDYQDALKWYVVARLCEIDVPISQQQKAQGYWAKWADELAQATNLERRSFQTRPPRATRKRFF